MSGANNYFPSSCSMDSLELYCSDDDDDDEVQHTRMSQKFRIRLHAANLPSKGVARGKAAPDTFAVISTEGAPLTRSIPKPSAMTRSHSNESNSSTTSTSVILGQTEVVYKSRNPQWTSAITLNYVTGSGSFFYVHLFDHCPGKTSHLQSFGTALFHVADLIASKNYTRVKRLRSGGCIFCRLEPVHGQLNLGKSAYLQLQAFNLIIPGKVFAPRKLNTVYEIAKHESLGWVVVHRSAPVMGSADPVYDAANINLEDLCESDFDRNLRISIYAVKSNLAKRGLIGITETTLRNLLTHSDHAFDGVNTVSEDEDREVKVCSNQLILQRSSKKLKEVGRIRVCKAVIRFDDDLPVSVSTSEHAPVIEIVDLAYLAPLALPRVTPLRSFSSYIEKGCQIDFCVAIDFTSSNGDPAKEGSYHYLGVNSLNDYEETITAIGQSLGRYSDNEEYAVWGFGAKFGGVVRHIFQCGPTATVTGVEGILAAYKSVFQSDLIMSGPTVFLQILQASAARAKHNHDALQKKPKYTVLLVITDGIMDNFEETRQRLDVYSEMPLSVVFVGVGRSDFGLMYQLCQPAAASRRCNTTFVEFRRHQHNPSALGEAALRNIPWQLCDYMQAQGL